MVVGREEGYRERIVVARLLDSTNAAGQRLPYMENISHHVMLGPRLTVTLSPLTQKLVFTSELNINRLSGPTQGSQRLSVAQSKSVPLGSRPCDRHCG